MSAFEPGVAMGSVLRAVAEAAARVRRHCEPGNNRKQLMEVEVVVGVAPLKWQQQHIK
jgi:hypothetical protein